MSVEAYISQFPKEVQIKLEQIRNLVKEIEPKAEDGFSYGVPALKLNNKNIIIYAAFQNHIGIYPTPRIIEKFNNDLKNYETSKGAIRFPIEDDLPMELIEKIIKECLGEEYHGID